MDKTSAKIISESLSVKTLVCQEAILSKVKGGETHPQGFLTQTDAHKYDLSQPVTPQVKRKIKDESQTLGGETPSKVLKISCDQEPLKILTGHLEEKKCERPKSYLLW